MDEKDAVQNFLGEEIVPKKDIFQEEKTETEEPAVEEEQDEKPLPFHKDPKVQRYVERQIEKALKNVQPSREQEFRKEVEDIKLPSSFVKLIGNDTPEKVEVLKDLSNYFSTLKGEARQEFLEEMKQQEAEARAQDEAALDELTTGFEQIEEEYGVDLDSDAKTRAEFVEYIRRISHKNEDGEVDQFPDIPAAWEDFQSRRKPQANTRAKELASRSLTRSSDATPTAPQGRSWKDVDKFLEKLKS